MLCANFLSDQTCSHIRILGVVLVAYYPSSPDEFGIFLGESFFDGNAGPYMFVEILKFLLDGLLYPRAGEFNICVFIPVGGAEVLVQRYGTQGAITHLQAGRPLGVSGGEVLGTNSSGHSRLNIVETTSGIDSMNNCLAPWLWRCFCVGCIANSS